jgi:hypothetical protein
MFTDRRRGLVPLALVLLAAAGGLVVGATALTPETAVAQEREILFNQVTVSSAEASLRLELGEGEELSVVFRDGRVLVDGAEAGRYTRGDALETAWRELLREAIALENAALARLLLEWSASDELTGDGANVARAVEERFRGTLAVTAARPATTFTLPAGQEAQGVLELLLRDTGRLRELTAAARDLRPNGLRIHTGESVSVGADERIEGSLLLLDGDLELDGTVEGDVFLIGGRIHLGSDARINGDLRWAGATVEGNRSAVRGRIREIVPVADRPEADLRQQIRREVEAATAQAVRAERRAAPSRGRARGVVGNLVGGVAGLIQTVMTFAILLGIGLAVLYFFPRNLEVVARTARNSTGRAAAVGLAGIVLAFPTWFLGLLVLVVSIIGIPLALVWIPGFPLALALATGLGYLAVARNLGQWVSGHDIQGMEGFDANRPAVQIGMGLAILLGAFALGHVFQIGGPWFGFFKGLLMAAGIFLTLAAACVGFGAVLLSRGGRDTTFAGMPWDDRPDPDGRAGVHV